MRTCFKINALCIVLALSFAPGVFAQVPTPDTEVERAKRGQTGMKFLTLSVDARQAALGGATTAETMGSSSALFANPASLARMQGNFNVNLALSQFITDINYNAGSAAFSPAGGSWGVFGISFVSVDYGEFIGTARAANDAGYIRTGDYSPNALAAGFGYARSFTDRFSVGGQVKYAMQDLGSHAVERADGEDIELDGAVFEDYSISTAAFDFGVLYNTGFRSLVIAMSVRNFSRELTYHIERFELPLTFQIGTSVNLIDFTSLDPNMHRFLLTVDAERPRDFAEHLRIGGEYTLFDVLSLRGGWGQAFVNPEDHEEGISLGAGLKYGAGNMGLGADYTYTSFGLFGDVNRFAVQFSF